MVTKLQIVLQEGNPETLREEKFRFQDFIHQI